MTLTPEQVDVMLADFAMQNDSLLAKTQQERPAVHDAVMNLLTILSKKFGTQAYVTTPAPQPISAPKPAPVRRKVKVQPEPVVQIAPVQPEPVEELTEQELKEAIDSLKPIAAFDDEVKQELNALKIRLKALKQKKS